MEEGRNMKRKRPFSAMIEEQQEMFWENTEQDMRSFFAKEYALGSETSNFSMFSPIKSAAAAGRQD